MESTQLIIFWSFIFGPNVGSMFNSDFGIPALFCLSLLIIN